MKRIALLVVLLLMALPLWADYGLSNVVKKQIDLDRQAGQSTDVEGKMSPLPTQRNTSQSISNMTTPEYKKSVFYPYTIHVASVKNKKDAMDQFRVKYQKFDVAFITKIDLGATGIWYRIDLGAYTTISKATDQMKDLKAKGIIDDESFIGSSVPYTIEIGVYDDRSVALNVADKLIGEGIVPYIMKETDTVYRLLSGAFPSTHSATPALEELISLGLQPKITKR